jgi:hypothetical protein
METSPIALYGKSLPVPFAYGYLCAFQAVVGTASVISSYRSAALDSEPGDFSERKAWLDPIDRYLVFGSGKPQPLDYFFLSLIQQGLAINFPSRERRIAITQEVGRTWWFGDAPISTYQDRESLHKRFAPSLWKNLDTWKFGAPGIDIHSVKSSEQLAQLGVQTFASELMQQSGIACQVHQLDKQMKVVIAECPFCLHQSPLCHVFLGVIDGLVAWLQGMNEHPQAMKVNETVSTGHSITLDIIS